jgi:hypothetical protein
MAFPAPRTLGDVRREVALGCNLGAQPQRTKQYQPVIDRVIRECHGHLSRMTEWDAAGGRSADIDLIVDQSAYALPDDCPVGNVQAVVAVNTDGSETDMDAGVRPNERDSVLNSSGQPLRYEVLNGNLVIYPKPDASWVTMRVYYRAAPNALTDDEDTITIDFETLVKYAVRKTRASLGMPMLESDQEMKDYIDLSIAAQGDGEVFHLGGKRSIKTMHRQNNRITRGMSAPSGPDWNPPGF